MKGRDTAIDITKAIGILLMVLGHCAIPSVLINFIFSFHMPLFFILSGYFFKEKDTSLLIRNGYYHLIRPYLITGVVIILLCLVEQHYHTAYLKLIAFLLGSGSGHWFGESVPIIGPIWFLPALFWCKIIYNLICKRTKHVFLYSFIISTISFVFGKYITTLPFGFLYGLCALVFYSMGHYWNIKRVALNSKWLFVGILIWAFCIKKGSLEIATYNCNLYPFSMIAAFIGTYITYKFSTIFPKKLSSPFCWLGKNTMYILCYHTLYFYILSVLNVYLFKPNDIIINDWMKLIICFVLSLGLPIIHVKIMLAINRN